MSPTPFEPNDADEILADFGEAIVCAAVPAVTRGLLDDTVAEDGFGESTVGRQLTVLKVRHGAFGTTKVTGTQVTVRGVAYAIDQPLPHGPSLYDHYALQVVRTRAGG